MQFKILAWAVGLAVVAVLVVTGAMIYKASRPAAPPLHGAMAKFKPAHPAKPEPPASFTGADGRKLEFDTFRGKLTLVNLWATWCAPCVEELPSLERLKRAHDSDRFQVVTISEDHGGKIAVVDFFKRTGLSLLPQYLDPDADLTRTLDAEGLPTTILLDPQGRELGRYAGATDWSSDDAWAVIDWYLQRENAPAQSARS